jgi:predicted transposase/invertase (TIGR01784 family)
LTPAFQALEPAGLLHRVYLEDLLKLSDPSRASFGVRLLRLLVLDPHAVPAEARALATTAHTQPEPLTTMDLIETILVYKLPRLTRQEIIAMLQLPETDLKQTRFYQEVFAEGEQEGLEKGLEQARHETAANLLSLTQMDNATIATITGLDQTAVAALRQTPRQAPATQSLRPTKARSAYSRNPVVAADGPRAKGRGPRRAPLALGSRPFCLQAAWRREA